MSYFAFVLISYQNLLLVLLNCRDHECKFFSPPSTTSDVSAEQRSNSEGKASNKENSKHKPKRRVPVIQSELGQPHPFYECITPLRCLLLKNTEPQKWAAIQQMMDHLEVRKQSKYFLRWCEILVLLNCINVCKNSKTFDGS